MRTTDFLFIDGVSAWTAYGVAVAKGGYLGVVQYPDLKTPEYIDWPEVHGIEPDLLSPCIDTKKSIRLDMFCKNSPAGFDAMMAVLHDRAYHDFYFKEIGVSVPLRYKETVSRNQVDSLTIFSLEFVCDESYLEVMAPYLGEKVYLAFNGDRLKFNKNLLLFTAFEDGLESHNHFRVRPSGVLFDGVDVSQYLIIPTEGTDEAITRPAPLKDNLIITSKAMSGQKYPDNTAVKDRKDVILPMVMRAVNPSQFWEKYLAFFELLVAPGGRVLTYKGKNYKFFYSSQSLSDFCKLTGNEIWCEFSLNVVFYEGD